MQTLSKYVKCPSCPRAVSFSYYRRHAADCHSGGNISFREIHSMKLPANEVFECPRCESLFHDLAEHFTTSSCERVSPDPDPSETSYAKRGSYQTSAQRHGPHFQQQRKLALNRDGWTCQMPGCTITYDEHCERDDLFPQGGGLHVHHIRDSQHFDSAEAADTLDNLISLCAEHHDQVQRGKRPAPQP
jgi:hypothetical protein